MASEDVKQAEPDSGENGPEGVRTEEGRDGRFPSPGAAMTVDVLMELSANSPTPLQLRHMARLLRVPRSTLHRVLQTLKAKGMVRQVDGTGYVLGDGVLKLTSHYRLSILPQIADPIVQRLYRQTAETVNLAVPRGNAMRIVHSVESSEALRMVSYVGKYDALHASAVGKSYLAALPDQTLHETLAALDLAPITSRTIVDRRMLVQEILRTRQRGFGIDDEESVEGVRCIGAAIRRPDALPVAAISVSGPAARLPLAAVERVGTLVMQAASTISCLLRETDVETDAACIGGSSQPGP